MWSVRAIRKYESQADGQLNFNFGEILHVIGQSERDGWLRGRRLNGDEGDFHTNYVQEIQQTSINMNLPVDQIGMNNNLTNERDYDNDDTFSSVSFPGPPVRPRRTLRSVSQNVPKFTASNKSMKIYDWLVLYEHNIEGDHERVELLQNQLSGTQVMTWFTQEIVPNIRTITWDKCKSRMLNRFGVSCSRPIIAAVNRKFEKNDSVEKYYTEKLSLLNQTLLPDIDKIALLTHGMPKRLQQLLSASHCSSTDEWKKTATLYVLEHKDNLPRNFSSSSSLNRDDDERGLDEEVD